MSNLRFEFQDSISINALTLLSFGFDQFDHHKPGFSLASVISRFTTKKRSFKGYEIAETTPNSVTGNVILPIDEDKDAITILSQRRDEIKKAINENQIKVDELDTKDCNEIRLNYTSATNWLSSIDKKIPSPQHSKNWRKDKKKNTLFFIAILQRLLKNENNANLANLIIENSEGALLNKDSQTFEKLLAEAKKFFEDETVK
ncbi:hypothetical protein [Thalassotalea aquiviva]|uniref:hypothetical protein n=1 Tax=Thalassotalea aquiviva TaxID=3242415 RepID=UPI003529FFD9